MPEYTLGYHIDKQKAWCVHILVPYGSTRLYINPQGGKQASDLNWPRYQIQGWYRNCNRFNRHQGCKSWWVDGDKWKRRRGFLKIHIGVDVSTKQIVSLKVTDERSHDAKHLPELVSQVQGKVSKVYKISKVLQTLHTIQRTIFHFCGIMVSYLQSR